MTQIPEYEEHRQRLLAARSDDPSAHARGVTDWRHQEAVDVEELSGEGDGANREA